MKQSMKRNSSRGGLGTGLSLLLLFGALALLLWRSLYSFCWSDESFYLSTVHRFWLGDAPFMDEWNTGQLYSVLLLPFYSAWRAVVGSTEGIYLGARIAAVLLMFGESLALWLLTRRRWPVASLCGALLVLLYAKANLAGLSYYTLSLFFFLGGLLILYGLWERGGGTLPAHSWPCRLLLMLAGVLEAFAVVCMPFAAVLWLAALPPLFAKKLRGLRAPVLWVIGGAALAAAVYLGWTLSRVSLGEILEYLPWVLSDPDSNTVSLPVLVLKFFLQPFYQLWLGLVFWGPALAVTLWRRLTRRPVEGRLRRWLLWAALAGFVLNILASGTMQGRAQLAVCVLGVQCWLLCPADKRPRRELIFFGLPGLAFAFIWQIGSNTGFSGMTLGFAAAAPFGAACVEALLRADEEETGQSVSARPLFGGFRAVTVLAVLLALPVLASGWQRVALVYRDAPLEACTTRLEAGPARGLYTSAGAAQQYEDLRQVLAEDESDGPLFVSALAPWAYLCTDRPVAAPTTWRVYTNSIILQGYYERHPDKLPDTVLLLAPEMGAYVSTIQPEESPAPNAPEEGGFLMEILQKDYVQNATPAGTLYSRRTDG